MRRPPLPAALSTIVPRKLFLNSKIPNSTSKGFAILALLLALSAPVPARAGFWDDLTGKGKEWQAWGDQSKGVAGSAAKAAGAGLEWLGGLFGGGSKGDAGPAALPGQSGGSPTGGALGWVRPVSEGPGERGLLPDKPKTKEGSAELVQAGNGLEAASPFSIAAALKSGSGGAIGGKGGFVVPKGKAVEGGIFSGAVGKKGGKEKAPPAGVSPAKKGEAKAEPQPTPKPTPAPAPGPAPSPKPAGDGKVGAKVGVTLPGESAQAEKKGGWFDGLKDIGNKVATYARERLPDLGWAVGDWAHGMGRELYGTVRDTAGGIVGGVVDAARHVRDGRYLDAAKDLGMIVPNAALRVVGGAVGIAARTVSPMGGLLGNVIDALNPTIPPARKLSQKEREMLKGIYGDSLNMDRIRVRDYTIGGDRPHSLGNGIYMRPGWKFEDGGSMSLTNPDGSFNEIGTEILVHEGAHVWQNQNGYGYLFETALARGKEWLLHKDTERVYNWTEYAKEGVPFEKLNAEAQGQLIQDYYASPQMIKRSGLGDYAEEAMKKVRAGQGAA